VRSGEQQIVRFNRAGNDVFVRVLRGSDDGTVGVPFFDVIDDAIAAVEAGDSSGMSRAVGEMDQLLRGNELALVQTGADQRTVENQTIRIEDNVLLLRSLQSDLEDLDYADGTFRRLGTNLTINTMGIGGEVYQVRELIVAGNAPDVPVTMNPQFPPPLSSAVLSVAVGA
jgi:hypothetical protein